MVSKFKERNIGLVYCVNFEIFAIFTIFLWILDIPSSLVRYSKLSMGKTFLQYMYVYILVFFNETRLVFTDWHGRLSLRSQLVNNYVSFTSWIQVHGKGPRNYNMQPRLVGGGAGGRKGDGGFGGEVATRKFNSPIWTEVWTPPLNKKFLDPPLKKHVLPLQ